MLLTRTNQQQCQRIAERMRVLVAQTATPTTSGYVKLTVSIGGAMNTPDDTPEGLLKRADRQLYIAKQRGRNRSLVPF